jgi:hypothetical protein
VKPPDQLLGSESAVRFILVLSLWLPYSAYAVLGDVPSSGEVQQSTSQVSKVSLKYVEWTEGSQTIREYLGTDGKVFAVTWGGPKNPNLTQLLGNYYQEYQTALDSPTNIHPRRGLATNSANLDVHRFGHMGALHGVVVLKDKIPATLRWIELL